MDQTQPLKSLDEITSENFYPDAQEPEYDGFQDPVRIAKIGGKLALPRRRNIISFSVCLELHGIRNSEILWPKHSICRLFIRMGTGNLLSSAAIRTLST
jgi:hypothetical protein